MRLATQIAIVVHIFAAIALVGSVAFNTLVLYPALKRIPPAHSAVISQKIGAALLWTGLGSLILLGITGFGLVWANGMWPALASGAFWSSPYGWRLGLMIAAWLGLVVTGTLSGWWYRRVLAVKLPMDAGLRELEERRAAQEYVNTWQDRLFYLNLALVVLAALGGALIRALK